MATLKLGMGKRQRPRNRLDLFDQSLSHGWDKTLKPAEISGFL